MSSVADQIRHLTGNHDEGEPEMLQRGRVELTTQADRTTGGIWQQGLSVQWYRKCQMMLFYRMLPTQVNRCYVIFDDQGRSSKLGS